MVNEKTISEISISIGIAEYQRNEEIQHFVHRADVTMYEAKERSGNSVVISPDAKELPKTAISQHS